jgi:hypothetical protein
MRNKGACRFSALAFLTRSNFVYADNGKLQLRHALNQSNGCSLLLSWFYRKLNAFALGAAFAFLLCGPSPAQDAAPPASRLAKRPTSTAGAKSEDPYEEQERLALLREKMRRENSDESGRVRPDLFAKAVAHMRRMKVAKQIGPDPAVAVDKKQ